MWLLHSKTTVDRFYNVALSLAHPVSQFCETASHCSKELQCTFSRKYRHCIIPTYRRMVVLYIVFQVKFEVLHYQCINFQVFSFQIKLMHNFTCLVFCFSSSSSLLHLHDASQFCIDFPYFTHSLDVLRHLHFLFEASNQYNLNVLF